MMTGFILASSPPGQLHGIEIREGIDLSRARGQRRFVLPATAPTPFSARSEEREPTDYEAFVAARHAVRDERSRPILDQLRAWLQAAAAEDRPLRRPRHVFTPAELPAVNRDVADPPRHERRADAPQLFRPPIGAGMPPAESPPGFSS